MSAIRITYTAPGYSPEKVTGRYVRVQGQRGAYEFKVFEAATNDRQGSRFYGQPGMGSTLREYITDGAELPEDLRARAIATKHTLKWD